MVSSAFEGIKMINIVTNIEGRKIMKEKLYF